MTHFIGWDIGGAHVKVAVIFQNKIIAVHQQPCPLWQGLDKLEHAVKRLLRDLPVNKNQKHAITMTGELVDLFADRHEGVGQIMQTMSRLLAGFEVQLFCGEQGLLTITTIDKTHYDDIASANWLASTSFAAKHFQNCLFVDIGSTTTDILLCQNGAVAAQGFSDYERLISQELVYTGIIRTPVMAVVQTVLDNQKNVGIMAEYFATMADVYRVTGELLETCDQNPTADGSEKTLEASARRLSRMVGDDFRIQELTRWQAVARNIRQQQIQRIQKSCELILKNKSVPLIGAGVGQFLVAEIAANLNLPYVDFSTLCTANKNLAFNPADCAPAVAVAFLLTN
jgi:probable H4MPT-linked C1 transfer pathway protein